MDELRLADEKKLTIYDIAREAGVSPSTVSRVLTNTPGVRKDKRELVQNIINKYSFRPNALAKGLSETKRQVIGIIMADVRNPFYANLFVACEQAAKKSGYSLLLENSLGLLENEIEQLTLMEEQRVDAVILVGGRVDDLHSEESFVEKVNQVSNFVPVILAGKLDGTSCCRIQINAIQAMDLVMEHLISLGHTKIAILGGFDHVAASFEKRQRYKQLLSKYQIPYRREFCETYGGYDYETGYLQMNKLFESGILPTAVIGINDYAAVGAMNCILEHGLRIPEDISVAGFDNTSICNMTNPRLTSIDYHYDLFAEKLVFAAVNAHQDTDSPALQLIETELVARGSTGPVR